METVALKVKKDDVFHKLALLSEVRSEGYAAALQFKSGEELEYIKSLEGKSNDELKAERQRLNAELYAL